MPVLALSVRQDTYLTELFCAVEGLRRELEYPPIDWEDHRAHARQGLLGRFPQLPDEPAITQEVTAKVELAVWLLRRTVPTVQERKAVFDAIRRGLIPASQYSPSKEWARLRELAQELVRLHTPQPPANEHMLLFEKKAKEQHRRAARAAVLGTVLGFLGDGDAAMMTLLQSVLK